MNKFNVIKFYSQTTLKHAKKGSHFEQRKNTIALCFRENQILFKRIKVVLDANHEAECRFKVGPAVKQLDSVIVSTVGYLNQLGLDYQFPYLNHNDVLQLFQSSLLLEAENIVKVYNKKFKKNLQLANIGEFSHSEDLLWV